jgi:nucleotide-binding universal stress UspA family protein
MRVMVGYDGSRGAGAAIEVAAQLLPGTFAYVAHVWSPPFASDTMRHRLWTGTQGVDAFIASIEREGAAEAVRMAGMGVVLAGAAGWTAEPLVERGYGGEGLQLAELAGKLDVDLAVVGSRGLDGARAVLGSASDMLVHYAPLPVLVVPYPLFVAERAALADGPVLVGWDGSAGAAQAVEAAEKLFGGRRIVLVQVDQDDAPVSPPAGHELVRAEILERHVPAGRAVAAALGRLAGERSAALVVVGSRGRSALREIVLGSAAMATLHHTQRPVLVVRNAGGE